MVQYDLFNTQTEEPYLGLVVVFPDLGLLNLTFVKEKISCSLLLDPDKSIAELEAISIEEVEKMINYIKFTETDCYSNTLGFMSDLYQIKESKFYEDYLQGVITIQYFLISLEKLSL